jgi:hypothetical protein
LKKLLLKELILASIVGFMVCITTSYADTCLPDISPSANCENLVLESSSASIIVPLELTISGSGSPAVFLSDPSASGITVTNSGKLTSTDSFGLWNVSLLTTIFNSGYIVGGEWGLVNQGSHGVTGIDELDTIPRPDTNITSLVNTGFISATYSGIYTDWGIFGTLTNTGTIIGSSTSGGITVQPEGALTTLNNLQGIGTTYIPIGGGDPITSGPLSYNGNVGANLPANYNIIINSTSNYGQLAVISGSGSMAFNVYGYTGQTLTSGVSASSVSNNHLYQNVLTGLIGSLSDSTITGTETDFSITGATGTYGGYSYALVADDSNVSGVWDLLFGSLGPTADDTQASLTTQARRLRTTFNSTMASGNFANMNTYDCNLFDKNNMCISAGGRYTNVDNPSSNNSAAVVVLGYKVNSNIRIGGFLDQSINNNTPTGIQVSNKNPMMGAFAVWNKNPDGLGYQVKIANAYQDKDVTSTRDAFGETGEAGTGKTNLNTQSYVGELSYAFQYQDSTIVRPYFALRYTNIKQDAYTETGVSTPLSYAKLGDRSTTALMGVKLNHALTPRTNLTASLGIEQDINHKTDQLTASGVADLTSENFNNHIKRTRPVASAGVYYAVTKTQRLSGEVYYQQLPFQSTGSATAYFNYMIGF